MKFIDFVNSRYNLDRDFQIKLKRKEKSPLMWIIHIILSISNFLRITDTKSFIDSYVTTIGRNIYWPKSLPKEVGRVLLHEMVHIYLWKAYWTYPLKYIFSKKWRAIYESYCVQIELYYKADFPSVGEVDDRAEDFISYGISWKDMYLLLLKRENEIKSNNIIPPVQAVIDIIELWKNYNKENSQ